MRRAFADTAYWIALINPRDNLHSAAVAMSSAFTSGEIVTSEMVFVEVCNHFCESGPHLRTMVRNSIQHLYASKNCHIIGQDANLFQRALAFYGKYRDKEWSLTDCSSMVIMQDERLRDILTHDSHFEQAGFAPLLNT